MTRATEEVTIEGVAGPTNPYGSVSYNTVLKELTMLWDALTAKRHVVVRVNIIMESEPMEHD